MALPHCVQLVGQHHLVDLGGRAGLVHHEAGPLGQLLGLHVELGRQRLVEGRGASVVGLGFLVELDLLGGRARLVLSALVETVASGLLAPAAALAMLLVLGSWREAAFHAWTLDEHGVWTWSSSAGPETARFLRWMLGAGATFTLAGLAGRDYTVSTADEAAPLLVATVPAQHSVWAGPYAGGPSGCPTGPFGTASTAAACRSQWVHPRPSSCRLLPWQLPKPVARDILERFTAST